MKNFIRIIVLILGFFSFSFLIASSLSLKGETNCAYTICDYNGKIAVFKNGERSPEKVFDVYSSSLPKEEYENILSGIKIKDDDELQELIEAYSS